MSPSHVVQGTHKLIHNIVQIAAEKEDASQSCLTYCVLQTTDGHAENATIPPHMRRYQWTGPMRPHYPLSPKRVVPDHIPRPDYADNGKHPHAILRTS
jgi:methionyl aminopeptidase